MNAHNLMVKDTFRERGPREGSPIIAMRFVPMALAAVRLDLSETDWERLYSTLVD